MDAAKSPLFSRPTNRKKKYYSTGSFLWLFLYFLISAITLQKKCLNGQMPANGVQFIRSVARISVSLYYKKSLVLAIA
jgi:hypothetical protein